MGVDNLANYKNDNEKRKKELKILVTEEEKELIQTFSSSVNLSVSTFVRNIVLDFIKNKKS